MKLGLLFTRNISLQNWADLGLFDREKQIYEEHLDRQNLSLVYWFTYGSKDLLLAKKLYEAKKLNNSILIIPKPKIFMGKAGNLLYSFLLPIIHRKKIKEIDLIKTNQMNGSWAGVLCKALYKKKLLVRTGNTLSIFIKEKKISKVFYTVSKWAEKIAYKACDHAIVAAEYDRNYIKNQYNIPEEDISVIKNYIDTSLFYDELKTRLDEVIYVGRLEKQKNIHNLIEAIARMDLKLHIYGSGSYEESLQSLASSYNANIIFHGRIPNNELSKKLNQYKYFIQPSLYEGMPKTLIEAMASGCICLATNVKGNNEVIQHLLNGYLIEGTSAHNIENGLIAIKEINEKEILISAQAYIKEQHSLNNFAINEELIFKKISKLQD